MEQASRAAAKAAAEMHAELLAHLDRVPADSIVLRARPITMDMTQLDCLSIHLSNPDKSRAVYMYRFYDGTIAGSWFVDERIRAADGSLWECSSGPMRPDDFGTLFEVRP